jgi:hypothetical protein
MSRTASRPTKHSTKGLSWAILSELKQQESEHDTSPSFSAKIKKKKRKVILPLLSVPQV